MKRLVVCCDGTWNKIDALCPTNVLKIAQAIQPVASDGIHQIVFYEEGLGTKWYDKVPGGAFGWGIDQNIQHAYRFLCLNYTEGDEIYLFGFSRGAYTVRSLAGLIYCSGLLSRPEICRATEAYDLYRDPKIKPSHPKAEEFRQKNGRRVPITLLGCWDTVGSLGVPDLVPFSPINQFINAKYRFHDTQLSSAVENALHAAAIDERRKTFDLTPMQKSPNQENQQLRQAWFPGGHGCVGGGMDENLGLSDAALLWMMEQIGELGLKLEFDPSRVEGGIKPDPLIDFNNAPGFYGLAGMHDRPISLDEWNELHHSVNIRWQNFKKTEEPAWWQNFKKPKETAYRPENLKDFEDILNAPLS